MSLVNVNKIAPSTGTTVTLGDASDVFQLPASAEIDIASGATLDINGTVDFSGATVSNLSAGKIGQMVYGSVASSGSTVTTAAYADSGLSVTITPAATSSKIILMLGGADWDTAAADTRGLNHRFYKNVAGAGDVSIDATLVEYRYGSVFAITPYCRTYVDEPSTTSAIEYTLYVKAYSNTVYYFRASRTYQLIAMEVLA